MALSLSNVNSTTNKNIYFKLSLSLSFFYFFFSLGETLQRWQMCIFNFSVTLQKGSKTCRRKAFLSGCFPKCTLSYQPHLRGCWSFFVQWESAETEKALSRICNDFVTIMGIKHRVFRHKPLSCRCFSSVCWSAHCPRKLPGLSKGVCALLAETQHSLFRTATSLRILELAKL